MNTYLPLFIGGSKPLFIGGSKPPPYGVSLLCRGDHWSPDLVDTFAGKVFAVF